MRETHIWYRDREASAFWLIILLVATTGPDDGAPAGEFTRVAELAREFNDVVERKEAVGPESWLARGALVTLMIV